MLFLEYSFLVNICFLDNRAVHSLHSRPTALSLAFMPSRFEANGSSWNNVIKHGVMLLTLRPDKAGV